MLLARRRLLPTALLLLFALPLSLAAARCEPSDELITLVVEGFGTAQFRDFEADAGGSRVELRGDVCIEAANGQWTVSAQRAVVAGLGEGEQFSARVEEPTVRLEEWHLAADTLTANEVGMVLAAATFTAPGVVGTAGSIRLGLEGETVIASEVRVLGEDYRLEALQAHLEGMVVIMTTATITTCTCPGEPFYTVVGQEARLDIEGQSVNITAGELSIGGLNIALGDEFELSSERLARLRSPLVLEYLPATTGVGVVAPGLELEEGLALEMGLLGLGAAGPLNAFALLHYRDEGVSFSVGEARGGPRADAEFTERVAPAVDVVFAVHNRHYAASDYLHQGLLQLRMRPDAVKLGSARSLVLRGEAFLAATSQVVAGLEVASPRLGVAASATLQTPLLPGGTLSLAGDGQWTAYPALQTSQYGVTLRPQWSYREGPVAIDLGYHRRWTDSGSPFTLDRLSPINSASVSASLTGPLATEVNGSARFDTAYDLLKLGGGVTDGLERLSLAFGVSYPVGEWALRTAVGLELAGLIDPDPAGDRDAHVAVSASGTRGEWEMGGRVIYELRPGLEGLSLLEASAAVPLEFEDIALTPFLALDFAPLLLNGVAPAVSGHGLEVTWVSCCGTVQAGYRQRGGELTTSFGLALDH